MRLKMIAIFGLILLVSSLALAQDSGGGKPLPGEDETPTIDPTTEASPTAGAVETEAVETEAVETEAVETEEAAPTNTPEAVEEGVLPSAMLAAAGIEVSESELVLHETFDRPNSWEIGNYDTGSLFIDDDRYFVTVEDEGFFLWGQAGEIHENVVIQITTEQISEEDEVTYGVICRASTDNNADGYHLRITGDGDAMIFLYRNERRRDIIEATNIAAINQGQATNIITVACIDDYMALFVNGEFVLDYTDDTFDEGVTGLAASNSLGDPTTEIAFDDLYIWEIEDAAIAQLDSDPTDEPISELDPDSLAEEITSALEAGDVEIELRDLVFSEDFAQQGRWGVLDSDGSLIDVLDGVIVFEEPSEQLFTWSQNFDQASFDDVVVRIDAQHLSDTDETAYGVMCRVDPDSDALNAYSFLVGADGYYVIGKWEDNDFETLVDGTDSAINEGQDSNLIYVVCVGEYLAIYANGELLDEVEDDTFDEGRVGMGVIAYSDEPVSAQFDNLYIWDARD